LKSGYGGADFLHRFKQELFFFLFCLVSFSSVAAAYFLRSRGAAELELAAIQILESADEVFCAAEVPALQGVLSAGSTQSASSALLLKAFLPQTEQSRKSAALAAKTGQPKLLQWVAKQPACQRVAKTQSRVLAQKEVCSARTVTRSLYDSSDSE